MMRFRDLLQLIKFKIALAIAFTTATGFVLFANSTNLHLPLSMLGVLFLSSGSMALNQLQEQHFDARMQRTKERPLPRGSMNSTQVIAVAIVFLLAGTSIFYLFFPRLTVLLGLFNVLWYNLIYTPLKRVTPFAVVPGSLIGAVPALIGWTAAGGSIADLQIWALALFLIIWQIPHFWLILHYNNDDYEQAGFPGIERIFSNNNIKYIIFVWVLATTASSLLFPMLNLITHPVLIASLMLFNIGLIYIFYRMLALKKPTLRKLSMAGINLYMLMVLCLALANVFL